MAQEQDFPIFHVSSRRASRGPAAGRMIKRNANRRHMTVITSTGRWERTLLVTALGRVVGTHTDSGGVPAGHG
jgi:hypothetical protein